MSIESWENAVRPRDMAYHALDYIQHIQWVMHGMALMQMHLVQRALTHDRSKIREGWERNIYAQVVPEFEGKRFGTPEHQAVGDKLGPAWQHHLAHNAHHPEHHPEGINSMTLIDLIEMLCDWKAASLRQRQGSLQDSITLLKDQHGIGDQLETILRNTARILSEVGAPGIRDWSQRDLRFPRLF